MNENTKQKSAIYSAFNHNKTLEQQGTIQSGGPEWT